MSYVHSAYGTMYGWMAPQDRLDELMSAAIQELTELGVPQPTYGFDAALSGSDTLARFRPSGQWHIAVNPDQFAPAYVERLTERQLGDVANIIYHESRHAELTFREARAQAGLGQTAAQLVASMHIPQHIADDAVAHAICQSTMDRATGGYDGFYGSGADHGQQHGGVRHGDQGDGVRYLQRALAHLGYYHGPDDGDFGHNTVAAVEQFQEQYALHADGMCGEKTWEALARVYSE